MKILVAFLLTCLPVFAQASPQEALIAAIHQGTASPALNELVTKTLGPRGGTAVWGQDYLFVANSPTPATISIDQQPAVPMQPLEGSTLWMLLTKMRTGVTPEYQYYSAGKPLGARGDAVGYNPDSYARP